MLIIFQHLVTSQALPFLQPARGYVTEAVWTTTRAFFVDAGYGFIQPTDEKWSYARRIDMSYFELALGKP